MEPGYPDATANVNVLVMNENGKATHDVENGNDHNPLTIEWSHEYDHDRVTIESHF